MTNVTKTSWKEYTTILLFMLWANLFSGGVSAAEPSTSPDSEPAPESKEQATSDAKSNQQPPNKSGEKNGDFVPSEEISEDYAVSFPVDI